MFRIRFATLLIALLCCLGLCCPALAVEVGSDERYCFSSEDFDPEITGICLTGLPDKSLGVLTLGSRELKPGDILTAGQAAAMTFCPVRCEADRTAEISFLSVFSDRVSPETTVTIALRGKTDQPPTAEDSAIETYKNLSNTGALKAADPEGQALTFTVVRQPRRGEVTISPDGQFTYTPKKNKVGVDSFTYTAADPAGNISREATVTVTILKPTEATQYTDTAGDCCRFAAEWMKNTGIFVGETIGDNACFSPEKEVTRGEFVAMLTKALELPLPEEALTTAYSDPIPKWLQPYLTAALRAGLTAGLPEQEVFGADTAITGAEAEVMLRNAMDLPADEEPILPAWAGVTLEADLPLTRSQAAVALYQMTLMRK